MDEATVVQKCKSNEAFAQKIFYNAYVEDLMILCLRYIANREDAKEVLMDGFLSFFKNINSFTYQGSGSVKAWLKKIMINQCLMHLKKRNLLVVSDTLITDYENTNDSEDILDNLNAKDIIRMIHTLPDGYKTVFNLYIFENMTHKEISELTGISESTSKSQLHRAKALLRKKLLQAC